MNPYGFTVEHLRRRFTEEELIKLSDDADTGELQEPVLVDVIDRALRLFDFRASRFHVTPILPLPSGLDEQLLDVVAAKAVEWRRNKWLSDEDVNKARGEYWVRLLDRVDDWLDGLDSDKRETKIAGATEIAPAGGEGAGIWAKGGGGVCRNDLLRA